MISPDNSFSPECLTISLGPDCNLNCLYCFSKEDPSKEYTLLNEADFTKSVSKAADLVAANCREKNMPFFLGFQGSGEPLMHFSKLKSTYEVVSEIVRKNGLRMFSFITSNGCMEGEKYQWVAERFDRICLSIDGHEKLNDRLRRTKDKQGTYGRIVETVALLKRYHKTPVVRTTATRHNVSQLVPIVLHFVQDLKLIDIQVEPVYRTPSEDGLAPLPDVFVENYLEAKKLAADFGALLRYSGYRKDEKHGMYCMVDKNVLFIGPNGNASTCLFRDNESKESPFAIGNYNVQEDIFFIDKTKIDALKQTTRRLSDGCMNCEIKDSCVKGCPDVCILEPGDDGTIHQSLRCRINRLLFERESRHANGS